MPDLRIVAVVGLGAAIGGMCRLIVTALTMQRFGPGAAFWATMGINISGSFLIGGILALAQIRPELTPAWRFFLTTGILGGYTTFSTFSYEALQFAVNGLYLNAVAYAGGSVILGIAGAALGAAVARVAAG